MKELDEALDEKRKVDGNGKGREGRWVRGWVRLPSRPLAAGRVCLRNGIQRFEAHILRHKEMSASRQRNNARAGMVPSNSTPAACVVVVAFDRFPGRVSPR